MYIKITKLMAGPGGVRRPGCVAEIADQEARKLIAAGAGFACDINGNVLPEKPEVKPTQKPVKKAVKK